MKKAEVAHGEVFLRHDSTALVLSRERWPALTRSLDKRLQVRTIDLELVREDVRGILDALTRGEMTVGKEEAALSGLGQRMAQRFVPRKLLALDALLDSSSPLWEVAGWLEAIDSLHLLVTVLGALAEDIEMGLAVEERKSEKGESDG